MPRGNNTVTIRHSNHNSPKHPFYTSQHNTHYLTGIRCLRSSIRTILTSHSLQYLWRDRKSTRLNSSHANISYAVFCLKKKKSFLPKTRTLSPSKASLLQCTKGSRLPARVESLLSFRFALLRSLPTELSPTSRSLRVIG